MVAEQRALETRCLSGRLREQARSHRFCIQHKSNVGEHGQRDPVSVRPPSRASPLPQVLYTAQIQCGRARPERDGVCQAAFASKPAPTGFVYGTNPMWERACSRRGQHRR
ncbi:hypothetical protein C0J26_03455 [Pseudomonas baetica]|nr:hypothetical protein C0J26_03455 [Pseudomonas baetica]